MITPGDVRSLVTALEAQSWKVSKTTKGHYRAVPPDRTAQIVVFSAAREPNTWRNVLEDLRKSGFRIDDHVAIGNGKRTSEFAECPNCGESTFSLEKGLCIGVCAHEAPVKKHAASSLDALFEALRDAKELHSLAVAESNRAKAELLKAKERVDGCLRAEDETGKDLAEAKRLFDAAFGVEK